MTFMRSGWTKWFDYLDSRGRPLQVLKLSASQTTVYFQRQMKQFEITETCSQIQT